MCHLSKTELKLGLLTRLVALVAWVVKKLRRYNTFSINIKVLVPTGKEAMVVANPTTHMKLRATGGGSLVV